MSSCAIWLAGEASADGQLPHQVADAQALARDAAGACVEPRRARTPHGTRGTVDMDCSHGGEAAQRATETLQRHPPHYHLIPHPVSLRQFSSSKNDLCNDLTVECSARTDDADYAPSPDPNLLLLAPAPSAAAPPADAAAAAVSLPLLPNRLRQTCTRPPRPTKRRPARRRSTRPPAPLLLPRPLCTRRAARIECAFALGRVGTERLCSSLMVGRVTPAL
jgi:hypothetical protein